MSYNGLPAPRSPRLYCKKPKHRLFSVVLEVLGGVCFQSCMSVGAMVFLAVSWPRLVLANVNTNPVVPSIDFFVCRNDIIPRSIDLHACNNLGPCCEQERMPQCAVAPPCPKGAAELEHH